MCLDKNKYLVQHNGTCEKYSNQQTEHLQSIAAAALVAGSNVRVSIKIGLVEVDVHGDR